MQSEMDRARAAKPKMLTLADLAPVAVETCFLLGNESFCQKEFALMQ